MNKFTASLLAAALVFPAVAAPAMAAPQQPGHSQQDQKKQPAKKASSTAKKAVASNKGYKTFKKGEKFDKSRARNYQVVSYKSFKKLPKPKTGYRYVRSGSDVLLIGTSSFKVYAVYNGLFN